MSAITDPVIPSRGTLPVCLGRENLNRLGSLWFVMHHSDDPDLQALAVTCYLDESATDRGTPTAVVAGLLINKSHFIGLDKKWNAMLDEFGLRPGFHMKDFGLHGRFADMSPETRRRIFDRVLQIIRDHNICTLAVTLEHAQYRAVFPEDSERAMSQYGLCFIACVIGNHQIAAGNAYAKRVAFVVDSGNPYAEQVRLAHKDITRVQADGHFLNLGSLTFDLDDHITALQAADAVCWAVRRRAAKYPFVDGFEPLEGILDNQAHNQTPFSEVAMWEFLDALTTPAAPEILEP